MQFNNSNWSDDNCLIIVILSVLCVIISVIILNCYAFLIPMGYIY